MPTFLKICLIDNGVDQKLLKEICPSASPIKCIDLFPSTPVSGPKQNTNHGTVCMGLLSEFLQEARVLDFVKLYSISIADGTGVQTIESLERALTWCFAHSMDMVCLSIGCYRYCASRSIIGLIQKKTQCILVAAQANDGKITYPASLPNVIGTRYAPEVSKGKYQYIRCSTSGIEIATALPESKTLQLLGYTHIPANSFTPPYIASVLVKARIIHGVSWDLHTLRHFLATSSVANPHMTNALTIPSDLPPILIIQYNKTRKRVMRFFSRELQRLFLNSEYDCVLVEDSVARCHINRHRFALSSPSKSYLEKIIYLTDPSIVVVFCQEPVARELLAQNIGNVLITAHQMFRVYSGSPFCAIKIFKITHKAQAVYHWLLKHFC